MPSLSVLTVTYGSRWPQLKQTIESALESGCRVTVVSNGSAPSTKDALAALAADRADVDVVWFDTNRGSAPAFAAGLEQVYSHGLGVLILDDDNPLDPGAVDRLLQVEEAVRRIPGVPRLIALEMMRPVNRAHRAIASGQRTSEVFAELRPGAFQGFDLRSKFRPLRTNSIPGVANRAFDVDLPDGSRHRLRDIPNAMWGGLYLPREVAALGVLPNPDLVLYGDDNDMSRKLRELGVRILLDLDLRITDSIEWRDAPRTPGWRSKLPNTLQLDDSELWRVSYLFRNQAYLSRVQAGQRPSACFALTLNSAAKLVPFVAMGLIAGRGRFALDVAKASVRGLSGRLGQRYPLP